MNIWEIDKLVLFITFVIPGFISIKVYNLLVPSEKIDSSKIIIDAVAYSSINYAILSIPIFIIELNKINETHKYLYMFFYFFVLFVSPILLAIFWKWLRNRDFIQNNLPHPTTKPWDYVFSQRKPFWIKITLKNGNVIGGKYSEKSFASSSPVKEQIYLEETWIINSDGGFERKKDQTDGIIIMSDEILHIELIKYIIEEENYEQEKCNIN